MSSLDVHGIIKAFSGKRVLDQVEFTTNPGEVLVIMEPSGCGKTTLLRCILGSLDPDEGRVMINGEDMTSKPVEARNIGYVPQDFGLFPHLTVFDNVAFGLKIKK
nr:ATP-binding cassette domain-containing protein [Candidatus Sigynarchaeota archaeon]